MKKYWKICNNWCTSIDTFRVPKNAVYGRIDDKFYIVTDFKQFKSAHEKYKILVLDLRNSKISYKMISKNYYVIPFLWRFIKDNNLYETKIIAVDRAGAPRERRVPTAQSRCFKQCQVDGKGYSLEWERIYSKPVNPITEQEYTGMPVQYKDTKPVATFARFEGYTDTDYALRRDGLKIDQTKCRPGKPVTVNSPKSTQ